MNTHFSYTRPYEYTDFIEKRHRRDDDVCKNADASKRQRPQIMPPITPPGGNTHPPIDPPQPIGNQHPPIDPPQPSGGGHKLDLYY